MNQYNSAEEDSHVIAYRHLEDDASRAETQADAWRWEQCREAFEAIASGTWKYRSFARAVGKSDTHIHRQCQAWAIHGATTSLRRPSYTEAMAEVGGWATGPEKTRDIAEKGFRNLPTSAKARVIAEALEDEDVAEEVEEMQVSRRGVTPPVDWEKAPRQMADNMARQLKTDLATGALRAASASIAEAILCREEYGIRNQVEFDSELERHKGLVGRLEHGGSLTDADRAWAESLGVSL